MTEPESGRSSPVMTMSNVDLPDPDGPRSATASPRPIWRSMLLRIWTRLAPPPSERPTPWSAMPLPPPAEGCPEMSFIPLPGRPRPMALDARSYGRRRALVQIAGAVVSGAALAIGRKIEPAAAAAPVKIVALGDSLTAGYGLPAQAGFVPRLRAALSANGTDAEDANAEDSGETVTDGLARLDWSVPAGTDAVIVELGANDMLRGIKPEVIRQALDAIVGRLTP